jgi:hypothetical protein
MVGKALMKLVHHPVDLSKVLLIKKKAEVDHEKMLEVVDNLLKMM